jgi:dihydropteroate synthase
MIHLVGILNITPDSFSDGGKYIDPEIAIKRAEKMFIEGASLIDVGAESTRPNAIPLTDDEEWERLEPVLKILLKKFPGKISLDSHHPKNIIKAFNLGPVIVNDVTGMNNPEMIKTVAELTATVIVSHIPYIDIQLAHKLTPVIDVNQVKEELLNKESLLIKAGLTSDQIILDPGIGFGKTPEINLQLLSFAKLLPDKKIMIGYSRKRFLGERRMELQPNLKAGKVAKDSGAYYIRVHDVAGHKNLLK